MKNYYKYIFTVVYLLLIPHFAKYLVMVPNLLLVSFKSNVDGFDTIAIFLLITLAVFIFAVYKFISAIIECVYIKNTKKIVWNIMLLLLISLPVIFLFKDL